MTIDEARRNHQEAVLRQMKLQAALASQWHLSAHDRQMLHEAREEARSAAKIVRAIEQEEKRHAGA